MNAEDAKRLKRALIGVVTQTIRDLGGSTPDCLEVANVLHAQPPEWFIGREAKDVYAWAQDRTL